MPRRCWFDPGKETPYPLSGRPDGPQGRSGRVRKISPTPGFDSGKGKRFPLRHTSPDHPDS
jgi:hypothetical protein